MLLSIKVKNFRSFKDEQEISFVLKDGERAEKSRHIDVQTKAGKLRILKNAMIYGANASGKSNLFQAVIQLSNLVLFPTMSDEQGLYADTFGNNLENVRFEIQFLQNKNVYDYRLEYNRQEVVFEELKQNNELVFERQLQKINYPALAEELRPLLTTIRKTNLVLFFAQNNNQPIGKEAFVWFYNYRGGRSQNIIQKLKTSPELKERMIYALRFADFNITDIEIEENERPVVEFGVKFNPSQADQRDFDGFQQQKQTQKMTEVYFIHEHDGERFRVLLQNESVGTQQYFNIILLLLNANQENNFSILYDEFDLSLHQKLSQSLVKLLNSESNHVQFISTTHDSSLMNLLQKHQIYFVEKSHSGESEIFKLSDFEEIDKVRRDSAYAPKYDAGLFGASQIVNEAGLVSILGETSG
ncbi:MAG: ATP-binding protein [Streptococcaceae bacterium]|jgi:AAA15 family ATPase/GTPase|nr:ATP-binding protein [Streptococcaceae bacterium]